MKNTAN